MTVNEYVKAVKDLLRIGVLKSPLLLEDLSQYRYGATDAKEIIAKLTEELWQDVIVKGGDIKATTARAMAKEKESVYTTREFNEVMYQIEMATSEGLYKVTFGQFRDDFDLHEKTVKSLQELGYTVYVDDSRNWIIEW